MKTLSTMKNYSYIFLVWVSGIIFSIIPLIKINNTFRLLLLTENTYSESTAIMATKQNTF